MEWKNNVFTFMSIVGNYRHNKIQIYVCVDVYIVLEIWDLLTFDFLYLIFVLYSNINF